MKPNKFLKNRIGIYGIRNTVNNKVYVGKTKCMYRRCRQYVYDFKNKSLDHLNKYLFNAINKIGIDYFEFFPLEFCEINDVSERELWWMKRLKSTNRNYGYNLRTDSSTGMVTSHETSLKISNNLKRQWASGIRNTHSDKLKQNWKNNHSRKIQQSELLSQIKTKYVYIVTHPDGTIEKCKYSRLNELKIKSVISNFHRQNTNLSFCKGYKVERFSKGEI